MCLCIHMVIVTGHSRFSYASMLVISVTAGIHFLRLLFTLTWYLHVSRFIKLTPWSVSHLLAFCNLTNLCWWVTCMTWARHSTAVWISHYQGRIKDETASKDSSQTWSCWAFPVSGPD
jgi:hypothetical protein